MAKEYLDKNGLAYLWAKLKALFNNKQDKLTAGTNITIDSDNVISASGGSGGGDMYKSVYDTDNDGVVDSADYATIAGGADTDFFKITDVDVSVGTITAHNYITGTNHSMTAQSGYKAVGIVGWVTTNYRIRPTTHYVNSNTQLFSGFANTSASNVTSTNTVTFKVLWIKIT